MTIFLSKDVILHNTETVDFKKYKSALALQRGTCITCNAPSIEFFDLPLLPEFTIIPSESIPAGHFLPKPSAHIFYHRRVADIDDALPKHNGFLKSQLVLSRKLFLVCLVALKMYNKGRCFSFC